MPRTMPKYFGRLGRLELYGIEIVKLVDKNQDLQTISLIDSYNGWKETTLYQRADGEKIPLNQSLPLEEGFKPCSPYDGIVVKFGKREWGWDLRVILNEASEKDNGPKEVRVQDPTSESSAIVRYELLVKSVDACLELQYEGPGFIKILKGEIYATTEDRKGEIDATISTKRVLMSYLFPDGPRLAPGDKLKLVRNVLGLPIEAALCVTVDLEYQELSTDNDPITKQICLTKSIRVPDRRKVSQRTFSFHDKKLSLKCTWSDEIYFED